MRASALAVVLLCLPLAMPLASAAETCEQPNYVLRACADPDAPSASWDSTPVFTPSPAPNVGIWLHLQADGSGVNATTRDEVRALWLDGQDGAARACWRSSGTVVWHQCLDANDPSTLPTVPLDPQVYVDYANDVVQDALRDPLVRCLLTRICPL